jgi:hypothetical protein
LSSFFGFFGFGAGAGKIGDGFGIATTWML